MPEYILTEKLNAFDQLTLVRKLSPAIPVVDGLIREENKAKDKNLLTVLMLGQLSDADSEYVVKKCLSVVSRVQETGTAKVQSPTGQLMFDDMSMADILQLVSQVIEVNVGDFLRTALSDLNKG